MFSKNQKVHSKKVLFSVLGIVLIAALALSACSPQAAGEVMETIEGAATDLLPTEVMTEAPTEAMTEEPTEAPTEAPTEVMTEEPTAEPTEMEATPLPGTGDGEAGVPSVSVTNQEIVDGAVTIPVVVSDGPGWIVIHINEDGSPGEVIGVAPVADGANADVLVPIDATKATESLFAMLHTDAGTPYSYDFPGDDVPVMVDGQVVNVPFDVEGEIPTELTPAVVTIDQPFGDDGSVLVPAVLSQAEGWLVIHADADGGPGPVLGWAPVVAGLNTNVVVDLGGNEPTETLFAMLHMDVGEVGTYEFPGADGPVQVNGQVVTPPFMLIEESAGGGAMDMATGTPEAGGGDTGDQGTPVSGTAEVMMVGFNFSPSEIRVTAGTTVIWTNSTDLPHTVTADNGEFDSGNMETGDTFEFTFDQPGTYPYYCMYHGSAGGGGMSGVVIVE